MAGFVLDEPAARSHGPLLMIEAAELAAEVDGLPVNDRVEYFEQAVEGDMVVRSDCGDNQKTEILVSAEKFPTRYGEPQSDPDADGYRRYLPLGEEMNYVIASADDGEFAMEAPWGEKMVVRPGDAVVQIPSDPQDIYRIYGPEFECTYEIVEPAPN